MSELATRVMEKMRNHSGLEVTSTNKPPVRRAKVLKVEPPAPPPPPPEEQPSGDTTKRKQGTAWQRKHVHPNEDGAFKPLMVIASLSQAEAWAVGSLVSQAFEQAHGHRPPWIRDRFMPPKRLKNGALMQWIVRGYRDEDLELIQQVLKSSAERNGRSHDHGQETQPSR
ncbi:MAG: hypothetical protein L0312_20145 [Acidobacteria bacterium]|nr:hypothetical protein [Acidobacteriota bacterium]